MQEVEAYTCPSKDIIAATLAFLIFLLLQQLGVLGVQVRLEADI